jgi:hypothetical protein
VGSILKCFEKTPVLKSEHKNYDTAPCHVFFISAAIKKQGDLYLSCMLDFKLSVEYQQSKTTSSIVFRMKYRSESQDVTSLKKYMFGNFSFTSKKKKKMGSR